MPKYKVTLARACWQYCEVEIEAESKAGAVNKLKYGREDGQIATSAELDAVWDDISLDWGWPEPDDEIIWPKQDDDIEDLVEEVK